jgi:glycosyltransferase involved in cell wall biosynthesis
MCSMNKLSSLSIFFPCFNDEHTIGILIEDAYEIAKKYADSWEVLVINDGSTDASSDILINLKKRYPVLRIITHAVNKGYGGALASGLSHSTKEWVFYTDGDGQYKVEDFTKLFHLLDENTDFINGIKRTRSDSMHRIYFGKIYNLIARRMFHITISDIDCDFRLFRRSIYKKLDLSLTCRSGAVCTELVKKAEISGARFKEVHVNHYKRKYGKSEFFRIRPLLHTGVEFLKLWFDLQLMNPSKTKL